MPDALLAGALEVELGGLELGMEAGGAVVGADAGGREFVWRQILISDGEPSTQNMYVPRGGTASSKRSAQRKLSRKHSSWHQSSQYHRLRKPE